MHTHLYFAVASLIAPSTVSSAQQHLAWIGDFRILERQFAAVIDAGGQVDFMTQRVYADLQLVFGRYEEAEQLHRDALKPLAGDRDRFRVQSCRNAAWQALFLQRNSAALACFRRIVEGERVEINQQIEAWLGLTLVMFQLGQLGAAWECAERTEELAQEHGLSRWQILAVVLQRDLATQLRLRGSDALTDHVFWRSLVTEVRLPPEGWSVKLLNPTEAGVLGRHVVFLQQLSMLAEGGQYSSEVLTEYVNWAGGLLGAAEYVRFVRLDVALAALAGGVPDLARHMFEAFGEPGAALPRGGHWLLDYLFCLAEVQRRLGRRNEGDINYRRYCLHAMRRTREQVSVIHTLLPMPVQREQTVVTDDVSARLVGKYRRAYTYLVEHLDQPDLSVKEVATYIGVTERALQLVMRNRLGISPTQLIRRLRMERIYNELISEGAPKNVLAIAAKWGVRHRSTLANAYRREFNESPSETIMRSAA